MKGKYISVYARIVFWIDDPQRIKTLTLAMLWDDGFIAYLNSQRVENQYGPTNPAYDQPANTSDHETCCSCKPDQFDLSPFIDVLTPGYNVLALQVHNTTLGSSDFLFIPELFSTELPTPGDVEPDGDIDLDDLHVFAEGWLAEAGEVRYVPVCDIDSTPDGIIILLDLAVLSKTGPQAFDPGAICLILVFRCRLIASLSHRDRIFMDRFIYQSNH
jgi:hypothetical protein